MNKRLWEQIMAAFIPVIISALVWAFVDLQTLKAKDDYQDTTIHAATGFLNKRVDEFSKQLDRIERKVDRIRYEKRR